MRALPPPLRAALFWALPPAILYLIVRQLDLDRLADLAIGANPLAIVLGASLTGLQLLAGAARWYHLGRPQGCAPQPFSLSLAAYWRSLAIGAVTPGSVGSDVYRAVLGGRLVGRFGSSAFVIVVEKMVALASCVLLIACVFPFVHFANVPAPLSRAIDAAYFLLVAGTVLLPLLAATHRTRWFESAIEGIGAWASALSRRAAKSAGAPPPDGNPPPVPAAVALRSALALRSLLPALALSLAIHLVGAIQAQIFLQALGYDLPLVANVFVSPLVMLVLTIPITVGGLGVREGTFVLCYAAFGVPTEIALLVSFLFLISTMVSHGLGALLFMVRRAPATAP